MTSLACVWEVYSHTGILLRDYLISGHKLLAALIGHFCWLALHNWRSSYLCTSKQQAVRRNACGILLREKKLLNRK